MKSVTERSPQANYQRRKRAAGLCPRCGSGQPAFNAARGKPFGLCPPCLEAKRLTQRLLMRRRAAAGKVAVA